MGILSPYYAASFTGTSFWEQDSSGWHPGLTVETDGTLYNQMGGNHTFIDMGRAPIIFEIQAGVEGAQATSLLAKRGDSGTLVWSRGTMTATLLDILPTEADISALDANTLTLRFFSDDLPSSIIPSGGLTSDAGALLLTDGGAYIIGG
jgi:hypothetical protein